MSMRDPVDPDDPKGLIRESYRIDGIGEGECRSILVDWALSLPATQDTAKALARLAARYVSASPDHPMSRLMLAGGQGGPPPAPSRRGGSAGRRDRTL